MAPQSSTSGEEDHPDPDRRKGQTEGEGAFEGRLGWALLAVVLLAQVGLMVGAFLPVPHSGGDNAGYLGLAHSLLERGAYLDLYLPGEPIHTKYPPGFPALLAGARILGAESWVAFKSVVAVAATLSVLFTYLWAREHRGPVFGALVAGLLASSSALIYHSHWILSDVPFLALTLASLWSLARWEKNRDSSDLWLVFGAGAAIGAYFTRSAGLPLIVALGAVLALQRRWKSLGAFGAAFAIPAFAWWLRNRGAPDTYLAEVWLVDPYQPELGRVGIGGLVGRMVANAWGYVSSHIPGGITGLDGGAAAAVGLAVVGLALYGWGRRARDGLREDGDGLGVLEVFVPLYAGLVLLWPEVWSGDRFALPLLPPLLLYGGMALREGARRSWPRAATPASMAGVLLLGGTALWSWSGEARVASRCLSLTRSQGVWACAGAAMSDFARAAAWSGDHLPEGSAVLSRKPRFFYLLGGVKSQVFPFSRDPADFFEEVERWEADYVLLDQLDDLAVYYVGATIRARPASFCAARAFGTRQNPGSQLLGIVGTPDEVRGERRSGGEVRLSPCPSGMTRGDPARVPDYSSSVVPLFGRSES